MRDPGWPHDTAPDAPHMVVQLVPIIHYRAICRTCGWSGTEWIERKDADEDIRTHRCGHQWSKPC